MKRKVRSIALLLLITLLLGCWSRVEINDLAIVGMVGIDLAGEEEVELWINVIVPARAGGAPGTGVSPAQPGNAFITLSARGATVLQAAHRLQTELPRRIFWAHARVILIGERLAKESSRLAIDFLTRHRELRLTNYVLIVPGDVRDVMANPVDLERLPSEYMREIERTNLVPVSTVRDWVQDLASKGADPLLAVAELQEPPPGAPEGQRTGVTIRRAALFRGEKLVDYIDYHTARAILWLRGEVKRGVVTAALPDGQRVSVEVLYSSVEHKVRWENGHVTFYVFVTVEGDVAEQQGKLDLSDPAQLRRVEATMDKVLKARMEEAMRSMKEQRSDPARFGEEVHRQMPALWQRLRAHWQTEHFQKARLVLSVQTHVRRTGLTGQPQGVHEDELKKESR